MSNVFARAPFGAIVGVRVAGYWKPLIKFLIPLAIVVVLLRSIGVF